MAKNTNTNKVTEAIAQEKGGLNTEWRKLVVYKWNKENRAALTSSDAEILGVGKTEFHHYKNGQKKFFDAVKDYCKAGMEDFSHTDKELQSKLKKVYDSWRNLIEMIQKVDASDTEVIPFRKFDANQLIGVIRKKIFCGDQAIWGTEGETAFRAKVEDYLGSLVVRNIILDENETETVNTYQRAVAKINSSNEKINELNKLIPNLKNILSKVKDIEEARKAVAQQIKDAEDSLATVTKAKNQAEKTQKEYSAKYEAVLLKLNKAA